MGCKVCTRCVMNDKGDNTIFFDEKGVCNYCKAAEEANRQCYFPNEEGKEKLDKIINTIKEERKK